MRICQDSKSARKLIKMKEFWWNLALVKYIFHWDTNTLQSHYNSHLWGNIKMDFVRKWSLLSGGICSKTGMQKLAVINRWLLLGCDQLWRFHCAYRAAISLAGISSQLNCLKAVSYISITNGGDFSTSISLIGLFSILFCCANIGNILFYICNCSVYFKTSWLQIVWF